MITLLLALLIGVVAGSRTFMAPAAVSWAAYREWLPLIDTPLAWFGGTVTSWVILLLALGELVTDQLPSTPSRKTPAQFGARLVSGGLSGAAIGAPSGMLPSGLVAGLAGAVAGTLAGAEARARLAASFGGDRPAALIEDAAAIVVAVVVALAL